jgi:hypothetical protein
MKMTWPPPYGDIQLLEAVQDDLVRFVRCCKLVLSYHDVEAARVAGRTKISGCACI